MNEIVVPNYPNAVDIYNAMIFPGVSGIAPLGISNTTVTYDFSNTMTYDGVTFRNWDAHYKSLSRQILDQFETMLDVSFVETGHDATIRHVELGLADDIPGSTVGIGGYGWSSWGGTVDYNGMAFSEDRGDQSYLETFAHELGHALGLKHPFQGDFQLPDEFDHSGYTVMSYTTDPGATDRNGYTGRYTELLGEELALFDVIALQEMWGANLTNNTGDTSYGLGTPMSRVLTDGGGIDTLELGDWHSVNMNAIIDLGRGTSSEIARDTGTRPEFLRFGIDQNTDIENVVAPVTEKVSVKGNDLANSISASEVFGTGGFAAADLFEGLGGNDTLSGFTGDDTLYGGDGDDILIGGEAGALSGGNTDRDILLGQAGSDHLIGGWGDDILSGDAMTLAEVYQEMAEAGITIA